MEKAKSGCVCVPGIRSSPAKCISCWNFDSQSILGQLIGVYPREIGLSKSRHCSGRVSGDLPSRFPK